MDIVSALKRCVIAAAIFAAPTAALGQQRKDVTIGLSSASFATAAVRLAQDLGFFAKRGIDARFVVTDGSGSALAGILSGSFNLGVLGLPELVIVHARGQKVVSIATVYGGFATSLVLSKGVADKLGVSPNATMNDRLKALDGRLIATVSATAGGTVAFLAAAHAAGAKVRLTYLAQPAMQAALETGAIEGYLSSAPYWAFPIVKGQGVLWISGPKGEFPSESTPTVTALLLAMRGYAEAQPDLMRNLNAALVDLSKAIDDRPTEVRAALARLYPSLDAPTLDLLFAAESSGWKSKPLTAKDMAREIGFVKMTGIPLPQVDSIDPASMLFP